MFSNDKIIITQNPFSKGEIWTVKMFVEGQKIILTNHNYVDSITCMKILGKF